MKNIVITGSNGNLGRVVTAAFLDKGYRVIATVSSESSRSEHKEHANLDVQVINLTDESATSAFVSVILNRYKTIDAALLLAGGFAAGNIAKTTIADIDAQINLNFKTAYNVARPLFTHMLDKGNGRIVFIGSRPALEASAGKNMIAYGLSKSLLFKLSDYMNAEAKGKNVVSTVVAPSTIDTEANRKSMPDADPEKWVKPSSLAEIFQFIVGDSGAPLRETVMKVYNNA